MTLADNPFLFRFELVWLYALIVVITKTKNIGTLNQKIPHIICATVEVRKPSWNDWGNFCQISLTDNMWAVVGNEIPQATFALLFYYSIWNVFFTIKLGNDYEYEMLSNNFKYSSTTHLWLWLYYFLYKVHLKNGFMIRRLWIVTCWNDVVLPFWTILELVTFFFFMRKRSL